jgi:hypothetical protein
MPDSERSEQALGLADFLTDLRSELAEAAQRAESDPLRLELDEVQVSLDVAVTLGRKSEGSAKAGAKFWVIASAEAGVRGERSVQRATTHHLTLTLKPRLEQVVIGEDGRPAVIRTQVDVAGAVEADEEGPDRP